MRRSLAAGFSAVMIAGPLALVASQSGSVAATAAPKPPSNPTVRIGGPQHFCGTNGITCAEPATTWGEVHQVGNPNSSHGYDWSVAHGAKITEYIGHDEPAALFYSNQPGSGNNVSYQMQLPTDPPTVPKQDGSGGTDSFQLHPAFWLGMDMCDSQGSPNPDGLALDGHPTVACTPDSNKNIYASTDPNSSHYFGLGPGQAFEEMQFYPPGWAPWPAGVSCTAKQWCAALNIDTFSTNQNTGQFNNAACLNSVGPEPVNFAFITKNGVATAPANPGAPQHFIPDTKKDFLMNPGDKITVHLSDTANGLRVVINDLTTHRTGSMTASASNGFGNVVFDPNAATCTITPYDFHPEFSTSTPQTRVTAAAHTYNVSFSDEIGHFEYCGKVGTDPNSTCLKPLGADTNDGDTAGPDPAGDDDFCLPASASLAVKIGGCLDTDGDFDGVNYGFNWPGSISNPVADRLLHPTSELFSSPTTVGGKGYQSMAFEADLSRIESADTAFRVDVPCQRHVTNPADPSPGTGCVNPPPNSTFYPFYTTRNTGHGCMWQEGGPYIPGTTNTFGGSSRTEFGPLRVISYPAAPFVVSQRLNDFRRNLSNVPC